MSELNSLMNRVNYDLQALLNALRLDTNLDSSLPPLSPPPPLPLLRARPAAHQVNPSAYFPVIPTQFAKAIRPEWTDEQAKRASKIVTYRESEDSGRFRHDLVS